MAEVEDTSLASNDNISEAAEAAIAQLSKDPKFQSILQKHLNASSHRSIYENLPLAVKRRVRSLKNIQVDILKVEAQFYEEIQHLEAKYQNLYQPLFDKRQQIVNGVYEPSLNECKWMDSDEEDDDEIDDNKENRSTEQTSVDSEATASLTSSNGTKSESKGSGINSFWLTCMKNTDIFEEYIEEHDDPILQHLTDIKLKYGDTKGLDFMLEFHFSDNEYFTNKVLTKKYIMTCEVSPEDPFSFEGAAITEVKGCKIDWKKGKNVTVKTVKKKQKHKGKGQSRVVTKTVPNDSFFNFFSPPDPNTFDSKEDHEVEELSLQLESDINRAEFIRDRLIPKAVLYFTGEIIEDDDEEVGIDAEDDDDSEDSEGGGDDDYNPQSDVQNAKPECKQQ